MRAKQACRNERIDWDVDLKAAVLGGYRLLFYYLFAAIGVNANQHLSLSTTRRHLAFENDRKDNTLRLRASPRDKKPKKHNKCTTSVHRSQNISPAIESWHPPQRVCAQWMYGRRLRTSEIADSALVR